MERPGFNFAFTEADMNLLQAPSQDDLRALYDRIRGVATDYDKESGDMTGGGINCGDMRSLTVDFHIAPRMEPQSGMRHGATLEVEDLQAGPEPETAAYEMWWKTDRELDRDTYFELRESGTSCDAETARRLLGYLSPMAEVEGEAVA
jgi:hypothetical protein